MQQDSGFWEFQQPSQSCRQQLKSGLCSPIRTVRLLSEAPHSKGCCLKHTSRAIAEREGSLQDSVFWLRVQMSMLVRAPSRLAWSSHP